MAHGLGTQFFHALAEKRLEFRRFPCVAVAPASVLVHGVPFLPKFIYGFGAQHRYLEKGGNATTYLSFDRHSLGTTVAARLVIDT